LPLNFRAARSFGPWGLDWDVVAVFVACLEEGSVRFGCFGVCTGWSYMRLVVVLLLMLLWEYLT